MFKIATIADITELFKRIEPNLVGGIGQHGAMIQNC